MRYLSVCSGIEAFSCAVDGEGWTPVAFSEIEKFPSAVLAHRFPDVPNLGDFTKIDVTTLGQVDWLVAGTPCQAFSVAGLRQSLADDRGNLTLEFVRLAHALQENNGLRGLLWENVPGCLSTKDNAFGCFLGALVGHDGPLVTPHGGRWADVGMVAGPRARAAWRILNSQYFGVPQRRRRVFLVLDFGNGPDPAEVLFEPRSQGRGVEPGGTPGQEIAGTLGGSSQSGGFRTTDLDNSGAFIVPALTKSGRGVDRVGDPRGQDPLVVSHALTGEGFDASEDGTGRGTPIVAIQGSMIGRADDAGPQGDGIGEDGTMFTLTKADRHAVAYLGNAEGGNAEVPSKALTGATGAPPSARGGDIVVVAFGSKDAGGDASVDISPPLKASGHVKSHANGGAPPAIAFGAQNSASQGDSVSDEVTPGLDKSKVPAVAFNYQMGAKAEGIGLAEEQAPTIGQNATTAVAIAMRGRDGGNMPELSDQMPALRGADGGSTRAMAQTGMQVRRLTPTECERLQDFPDGWTAIPGLTGWRDVGDDEDIDELKAMGLEVRTSKTGKLRVNDPDGPRYKALGNSFTVSVIRWLARRIMASVQAQERARAPM